MNRTHCIHGHSEGFYKDGACKRCRSIYEKEYYQKNLEKIKARTRQWKKENPECVKDWQKRNPEMVNAYVRLWGKNNPEKVRAAAAKKYATKLQAIPKWANLEKIKEIYVGCPQGYEVDHIIPLRGKTVSGLHVEHNLQYLTKSENRTKGNRLTP